MTPEIQAKLIDGSIATAVIVALIFLINALGNLLQRRNGNGNSKDISELKKKVNNEFSHELQEIRADINELWKEVRKHGEDIAVIKAEKFK